MNNLFATLFIFSLFQCSYSQVFEGYNINLNNNTSPFFITYENEKTIYAFQKADVLNVTIKKFNSDDTNKSIILVSQDSDEFLIKTIKASDLDANKPYQFDIAFDLIKEHQNDFNFNKLYDIFIEDKGIRQKLLTFKLKKE